MNIPLINSNSKQDINTSLIAIRNAINELSRMKESASVEDLQRQINIINQQIVNFNSEFSAINTHLNTIDTNILNLQPVDTVASGNLHSVTSNGVYNALNTIIFGTATINTSNVNSGTIEWKKIGRIVLVNVTALNLKSWSGEDRNLATGLPLPLTDWIRFNLPPLNGTTPSQLLAIASDGLYTQGGSSHLGDFYGSFCYISAS